MLTVYIHFYKARGLYAQTQERRRKRRKGEEGERERKNNRAREGEREGKRERERVTIVHERVTIVALAVARSLLFSSTCRASPRSRLRASTPLTVHLSQPQGLGVAKRPWWRCGASGKLGGAARGASESRSTSPSLKGGGGQGRSKCHRGGAFGCPDRTLALWPRRRPDSEGAGGWIPCLHQRLRLLRPCVFVLTLSLSPSLFLRFLPPPSLPHPNYNCPACASLLSAHACAGWGNGAPRTCDQSRWRFQNMLRVDIQADLVRTYGRRADVRLHNHQVLNLKEGLGFRRARCRDGK